jgi:hypothetical protein
MENQLESGAQAALCVCVSFSSDRGVTVKTFEQKLLGTVDLDDSIGKKLK